MKFIQYLIATFFAFFITKAVGSVVATGEEEAKRGDRSEPRKLMVKCSSCGVYVLRERALTSGGAYVCSVSCSRNR